MQCVSLVEASRSQALIPKGCFQMKKLFLGLSLATLLAACGGGTPSSGNTPYKPVQGTFEDPFVLAVGESREDSISGEPRDEDHFAFTLQPGQRVQIETNTTKHDGSTLKPYMVVKVKTDYGWKELGRTLRDPYNPKVQGNAVFRTGNDATEPAQYSVMVTSSKIRHNSEKVSNDLPTNVYTFSIKEMK